MMRAIPPIDQRPGFRQLERFEHVLGVAVGADDLVTVLLDEDDTIARARVSAWAKARLVRVEIKVVGAITN